MNLGKDFSPLTAEGRIICEIDFPKQIEKAILHPFYLLSKISRNNYWKVHMSRTSPLSHYGFVVDCLAEALRELRKHNFTETIDRHFSLGSHLNARDVKAVRKTVSGLINLIYPHGDMSHDEP